MKPVHDIRFTNIDDETVGYFLRAFDSFEKDFDTVLRGEEFD